MVSALLAAGLKPGEDRLTAAAVSGLSTGCLSDSVPDAGISQSLAVLVQAGMPIDHPDDRNNTILMSSAQFCPASITATLISLGATVDAVNKQSFTPLQMALVSGKWDSAEVLVDHGAKLTAVQVRQLFFELPSKPSQRALLEKATR